MSRAVFVDTSYWIALLNPRDQLHERARSLSHSLGNIRMVTSEIVFVELLNDCSGRGETLRRGAARLIERLRRNPNLRIVPQSSLQFQKALSLYANRSDKAWSLTDCSSFQIMDHDGLTRALTHDHHFEQAGFRALLSG
jgi:uncharacterized protein